MNEINKIISARDYARNAHKEIKRKYSNDPYHYHLDRVASRVLTLDKSTEEMVCAAFLHDTIEDTWVEEHDLCFSFGETIADMVVALTSKSKQIKSKEYRRIRKIIDHEYLALQSKEVKTIKLIDRIDNLRDLGSNDLDFQRIYLDESKDLLLAIKDGHKDLAEELDELIGAKIDFLNGV